jgi:hypothetical protein
MERQQTYALDTKILHLTYESAVIRLSYNKIETLIHPVVHQV